VYWAVAVPKGIQVTVSLETVTVRRESVVDRMVSKEYVQTARPYDRDSAFSGAWIETGRSSRGPRRVEQFTYTSKFGRGLSSAGS
jgi:hypothetical protein